MAFIGATESQEEPKTFLTESGKRHTTVGCIGYNDKVAPKGLIPNVILNEIVSSENIDKVMYKKRGLNVTEVNLKDKLGDIGGISVGDIEQIANTECFIINDMKQKVLNIKRDLKKRDLSWRAGHKTIFE
jgi:hypothetical protein